MVKPTIGVDLDGVLANFQAGFLKISRRLMNKPDKKWQQLHWDIAEDGFTPHEVDRVWKHIRGTRNWWMELDKLPKTNEVMRQAHRFNYIFITSRVPTEGLPTVYQSQEWLNKQYALRDPLVIVATEKGPVAAECGLTAFIDDKPQNCLDVLAAVPNCRVAIMDQSYNKDFTDSRIERVANLNEWLKGL